VSLHRFLLHKLSSVLSQCYSTEACVVVGHRFTVRVCPRTQQIDFVSPNSKKEAAHSTRGSINQDGIMNLKAAIHASGCCNFCSRQIRRARWKEHKCGERAGECGPQAVGVEGTCQFGDFVTSTIGAASGRRESTAARWQAPCAYPTRGCCGGSAGSPPPSLDSSLAWCLTLG
jgi:hypothetical protein